MKYSSLHTHSQFSVKDGLCKVPDIVARAHELGYEALGLTDHGNMGGAARLYKACREYDIKPLPGMEAYVWLDRKMTKGKAHPDTQHLGLLATSRTGYENLVGLNNLMQDRYYQRPVLDFDELARYHEAGMLEGIAVMTGCWFGLLPTLVRDGDPSGVMNIVKTLDKWFDGCYVEIQNHQIERQDGWDEDDFNQVLFEIAQTAGLPVVITQDSHYIHESQRESHDLMKRMVSWSDDPDDAVFPGDGYHMVDTAWMEMHHPDHIFRAGMEGIADLVSRADVSIPFLNEFTLKVPDITYGGDPDKELFDLTVAAMARLEETLPKARVKEYWQRHDNELEVIFHAGFSGYMLLVKQITDWCTEQGIRWDIRGSALGSMTCYLMGITKLDPIKWNLPFERFLSRDHRNPPDIDIDIVHERRDEVIEYCKTRYHGARIGSWSKLGVDDEDEDKGSLPDLWKKWQARVHGLSFEQEKALTVPQDVRWELDKLERLGPLRGWSTGAAGVLAVPSEEDLRPVPMAWIASSATMVTAFEKKDIESLGLLKVDLLKLRTMSALHLMEQYTGVMADTIPLNDKKVFTAMGRGDVGKAFQISGYTSRKGYMDLKPTTIHDVIAGNALFRPAAMASGARDAYIARKHKKQPVKEYHPILMGETRDTYGVVVFQEQAMKMLQNLGLPVEDLDRAKKAIKASNGDTAQAVATMADIIEKVKRVCTIDLSEEDWTYVEDALSSYAGYGFNRAHATGYSLTGYQTMWYLVHHPVAYWAATLEAYRTASKNVAKSAVDAANKAGMKFKPPHVNKSGAGYRPDLDAGVIHQGLTTVKGVGPRVAEVIVANQPFTSLEDFATRCPSVGGAAQIRRGHSPAAAGGQIADLYEVGAFTGIPEKENTHG